MAAAVVAIARLRGLDHDRAGARDREHVPVECSRARDHAQADRQDSDDSACSLNGAAPGVRAETAVNVIA